MRILEILILCGFSGRSSALAAGWPGLRYSEAPVSHRHSVPARGFDMDWRLRSMRRPTVNEPGHAHELTFCCFRRFAFLKAERVCEWLAEAINEARADF